MHKVAALFLSALSVFANAQTASQPPSIELPPGARLLLTAKGQGAQIYACTDGHWTLKGPDAKLLDSNGQQIGTHFAGPTWKLTDGSEVKGKAIANQPSPENGSVAWLLLQAVPGTGTAKFADVAYIRRTETHGGAAPNEACTSGTTSVPYEANYSFYAAK
jgi:FtsP/CotA-like multicopper oxidase with cupredoxin domain